MPLYLSQASGKRKAPSPEKSQKTPKKMKSESEQASSAATPGSTLSKKVPCPSCTKKFKSEGGLEMHRQAVHGEDQN